jgi:hypothetical protein
MREREACGEVLSATRHRSRLGFPAPVLARWTPEARKANLLARRSVGLVGYVGQVKRKLGDNVPSEEVQEDKVTREALDNVAETIRKTNQSRRDLGARTMQTEDIKGFDNYYTVPFKPSLQSSIIAVLSRVSI